MSQQTAPKPSLDLTIALVVFIACIVYALYFKGVPIYDAAMVGAGVSIP
jgi:F0F1-type ATP synthase membrane subunit a